MAAGLCIIAFQYGVARQVIVKDARMIAERQLQLTGTRLAQNSSYLLFHDQPEILRQDLLATARQPQLQIILVVNENNLILDSSDYKLRGKQLEQTVWAGHLVPLIENSKSLSTDNLTNASVDVPTLAGIFPFSVPDVAATEYTMRTPHVVGIVADLRPSVRVIQKQVEMVALISGLLVLLVTLLFWYVMTRILDRPLKQLLIATRAIASGDFTVSANLRRVNELGEVSAALDTLAMVSAERELAVKSSKQLAEVIDVVRVGVSITDASSKDYPLVYVNKTLCEMTGFERAELLGQSVKILQRKNPQQSALRDIQLAQEKGAPVQVLLESTRKDGTTYMDELSLSPIFDDQENLTSYIGVNQDVTDKIATENRLRVAQRLEAVGQLSGGIAHDFNNLLSVILGNLELLNLQVSGREQRELVQEAESAATMGARLTRRLLAFAKRSSLEPSIVNLNDQVLSVTSLLRSIVGDSVVLSTQLSANPWLTKVDPSEVENTIINLAINARDAMRDGGRLLIDTANVEIRGQLASELDVGTGDYIRLMVSDTGTGMTREVVTHAFEPFYSTKELGKGTGLGLSSIYGFARQSGGQIVIDSEPGVGTHVSVYLPRCEEEADDAVITDDTSMLEGNSVRKRVLVVEDNAAVRKVTQKRIRALGYDTEQAENGSQAIDWLTKNGKNDFAVDIVFSDVVMDGGVSGYDLYEWVKQHLPDCQVILTSGYHENESLEDSRISALQKPYSMSELKVALSSRDAE